MGRVMTYAERLEWEKLPLRERRKRSNALTEKTRDRSDRREQDRQRRIEKIAIFDVETDPFDNENDTPVFPFLGVLYRDDAEPVVIWDENFEGFKLRVLQAFDDLPGRYTIYAHNGGRFDYLFLLSALRGRVTFKGRGLMSARLGRHELRDSYHLLPEKLSAFQKDEFDYTKMRADRRNAHRDEIIEYCIADCRYLLSVIKTFVQNFGFKLTIGQAAIAELKKDYEFDRCNEHLDGVFRPYYLGGRVDCLQGAGRFRGDFKLYDVNSMYPDAMANSKHPHLLSEVDFRHGEEPNEFTAFLKIRCKNHGALVQRVDAATQRQRLKRVAEMGFVSGGFSEGIFNTTIHEYNTAMHFGLLEDVEFLECIDFSHWTDFSKFIIPLYTKREALKIKIKEMVLQGMQNTAEFIEAVRWSIFYKLLMNNAYGKFAQNPEGFFEQFLCGPDEWPEFFNGLSMTERLDKLEEENWIIDEYMKPGSETELMFSLYLRPELDKRYNNVAIGASITGAARSRLLNGIQLARNPIYCDTDSIICEELSGVEFSASKLGAWDLEGEFDDIIICGKKLYACRNTSQNIAVGQWGPIAPRSKLRAKGLPGLTWNAYERMLAGETIQTKAKGVTIHKDGSQEYIARKARRTAPLNLSL